MFKNLLYKDPVANEFYWESLTFFILLFLLPVQPVQIQYKLPEINDCRFASNISWTHLNWTIHPSRPYFADLNLGPDLDVVFGLHLELVGVVLGLTLIFLVSSWTVFDFNLDFRAETFLTCHDLKPLSYRWSGADAGSQKMFRNLIFWEKITYHTNTCLLEKRCMHVCWYQCWLI